MATVGTVWDAILEELERLVPLRGAVIYGSRIAGTERETSDFDILAIVDDPALVKQAHVFRRRLAEATGLQVDLNLATPRGIRFRALLDPYIRYCLETGVRVGDVPDVRVPLSRQGMLDALIVIRHDLEEAQEFPLEERADWLRRTAKEIAVLEQAVAGRFDSVSYAHRVEELLTRPVEEQSSVLRQAAERLRRLIADLPPNEGDETLRLELALRRRGSR